MNRYARDRSDRRWGPKVERVELSQSHLLLRLIGAVIFLVIGAGALAYAFQQLVGTDPGWQEISVSSNSQVNCSSEYVLMYNLGASGVTAGTEQRAISALYTDACIQAYQLFNSEEHFEGVVNLADVNAQPNTVLRVSLPLYTALEQLEASGSRLLYLAPLYDWWGNLYGCQVDSEAAEFDPERNEEVRAAFDAILAFAADPESISLELLGNGEVRLNVSEAYLRFAEQEALSAFVDLYWMRQAFVIDYLADALMNEGYTLGNLTGQDGVFRDLSSGAEPYAFPVFDREGSTVYEAAVATGEQVSAVVSLRDFPLNDSDAERYFVYSDGTIRTPWLSETDGLPHSAVACLTGLSSKGSCGEVLSALLRCYIADEPDEGALEGLRADGIRSVYCKERTIFANGAFDFDGLYEKNGVSYAVN